MVKLQTRGSAQQQAARARLEDLFRRTPLPPNQLLTNLGLYMRSSVLAKLLYVNELYEHIIDVPGAVMEFGVWWGQNLCLFESLRAVYEPYNHARKVIGFDTFEGYSRPDTQDGASDLACSGNYAVSDGYERYLTDLLDYHQSENVLAHIKKYELVKGDATVTTRRYLQEHPETLIALAYFDMQLYRPTKECLLQIKPHLARGAVVALDELNCPEFPGETQALKEVWDLKEVRLRRSRYLPDRCYFVVGE